MQGQTLELNCRSYNCQNKIRPSCLLKTLSRLSSISKLPSINNWKIIKKGHEIKGVTKMTPLIQ